MTNLCLKCFGEGKICVECKEPPQECECAALPSPQLIDCADCGGFGGISDGILADPSPATAAAPTADDSPRS
jgi:hypothetical protein